MKASDITDDQFVSAVRAVSFARGGYADRWNLRTHLSASFPRITDRMVLGKARRVIRRGKVAGCICGCRGDFEVSSA